MRIGDLNSILLVAPNRFEDFGIASCCFTETPRCRINGLCFDAFGVMAKTRARNSAQPGLMSRNPFVQPDLGHGNNRQERPQKQNDLSLTAAASTAPLVSRP